MYFLFHSFILSFFLSLSLSLSLPLSLSLSLPKISIVFLIFIDPIPKNSSLNRSNEIIAVAFRHDLIRYN